MLPLVHINLYAVVLVVGGGDSTPGGSTGGGGDSNPGGSDSGTGGGDNPSVDMCSADLYPGQPVSNTRVAPGTGIGAHAQTGTKMCSPGDVDSNGVPDLVIAANGVGLGALLVVLLNEDMSVKSYTKLESGAGFDIRMSTAGKLGESLAALGDLDGDGVGEFMVAVTVPLTLYVVFLNPDGSSKNVVVLTNLPSGYGRFKMIPDDFAHGMSGVGDMDGDGLGDVAIGAGRAEVGGAFRLLFMNADGTGKEDVLVDPPESVDKWDAFGQEITRLGDLDGDGVPELAVSAPQHNSVHIVSLDKAAGSGNGAKRSIMSKEWRVVVGSQGWDGMTSLAAV